MLTKEEFTQLFNNRLNDPDAVNNAYSAGTPEEQKQYIAWLDELNPMKIPEPDDVFTELEGDIAEDMPEPTAVRAVEEAVRNLMSTAVDMPNARKLAERKRAQRSNMLRSIRSRFRLMEPFTVTECAQKVNRDPQEITSYLVSEIRSGSGLFAYDKTTNTFFLDNPFED